MTKLRKLEERISAIERRWINFWVLIMFIIFAAANLRMGWLAYSNPAITGTIEMATGLLMPVVNLVLGFIIAGFFWERGDD